MSIAIVTGSAGLVGSETCAYFAALGMDIIGIDNDMRAIFFGKEASTAWMRRKLEASVPRYRHVDLDIRDQAAIFQLFEYYGGEIELVVHTAAQPSHDWAANEPFTDFGVNSQGTLILLEATRRFAPDAVFIFMSTNKVYGDLPNQLPLLERETRWELESTHRWQNGIPEEMAIDATTHSFFGVSKAAADLYVQEYGRYLGMKTACFRGGCLTGPNHSGTQLHGFLAYLMKCTATGHGYSVFGYKGKQVRDNIHSSDLICAFHEFFKNPRVGQVYNMGGGCFSNCSMLEAIALCEEIAGRRLSWSYCEEPRKGDHIWWVSDTARFRAHYPAWRQQYNIPAILREMYEKNFQRWLAQTEIAI